MTIVFEVVVKRLFIGSRIEGFSIDTKLFTDKQKAIDYARHIVDVGDSMVCIECGKECCECKCCEGCAYCKCECCSCEGCECIHCCNHIQIKECCDHIFEDEDKEGYYFCNTCCKHTCEDENINDDCPHLGALGKKFSILSKK
jgi:hypothetical protein